jgi:ATP-dependent RNA helicase DOB1
MITEQYPSAQNCLHECVRPEDWVSQEYPPQAPAKEFPYKLDPFQQEAVNCLEKRESVLVAAHTSAGKTTVAEYAIAMSFRENQRVIYTSPIKALSNQKYRDMADTFSDVGLMTGDVTINPNASCMIMTTEILRSMLYRGSELCREMAWVIFDEVHYMRDRERGVVWEETMILLPDTVRFVFLSATIPNSREFAQWICQIKHQPCHLIYTNYRPVPLQHYVFPSGGDGVYLAVDETGQFRDDNFTRAVSAMEKGIESSQMLRTGKAKKQRQSANAKNDVLKIVKMCQERNYLPVIVFAFSKKECESNMMALRHVDLTKSDEKALIQQVFDNALATLSEEDRDLPQIQSLLPFLLRGVGIHHGGLLNCLREITEILFQENLLKALFCTETFAMGINVPSRTVVFTQISKWDGVERRVINSGEFIQMAGRAGRRGKDDRGLTITMLNENMDPETAKDMFTGLPLRLDSQFYIGYNMLLNMLRMEGVDPSYIIERSFAQFQKNKGRQTCQDLVEKLKHSLCVADGDLKQAVSVVEGSDVQGTAAELLHLELEVEQSLAKARAIVTIPANIVSHMNPGRILHLGSQRGWAILLKVEKRASLDSSQEEQFVAEVLVDESISIVPFSAIQKISRIRANIPQADVRSESARKSMAMQLKAILAHEKFKDSGLPELDPISDLKIEDLELKRLLSHAESLREKMKSNSLFSLMHKEERVEAIEMFEKFKKRVDVFSQLKEAELSLEHHAAIVLRDELRAMKRVIQRLGFVDRNNVVLDKGKMACEISSCDELILTEMVFNNVFDGMSAQHIIAMCSCLVLDEGGSEEGNDAGTVLQGEPELLAAFDKAKGIAVEISSVMTECKVPNHDPEVFTAKLKPQLVRPVLLWMEGKPFKDVMQATDLFEGSVVRVVRRLEELVRELILAAKSIGHKDLETKLIDGRAKLRRGIIFAASLYL